MESLTTDLREWAIDTARMALKLLVVTGLGVLASRWLSEQFSPRGTVLVCGTVIVVAVAFQIGRGYERA